MLTIKIDFNQDELATLTDIFGVWRKSGHYETPERTAVIDKILEAAKPGGSDGY